MIEIFNLKPGEIIYHSIAYLFGFCKSYDEPFIKVTDANQVTITWNLKNDYFKVMVKSKS
jgi:hypothetical protein